MTESTTTLPPEDDSDSGGNLMPAPAAKKRRAPAVKNPEAKAVATPVAEPEKSQRIILEENDNIPPTGLFIGINGRSFILRAGEECIVPQSVLNVLDDAVEDIPRVDNNGNVVDYRHKMRFPYRVLR